VKTHPVVVGTNLVASVGLRIVDPRRIPFQRLGGVGAEPPDPPVKRQRVGNRLAAGLQEEALQLLENQRLRH